MLVLKETIHCFFSLILSNNSEQNSSEQSNEVVRNDAVADQV